MKKTVFFALILSLLLALPLFASCDMLTNIISPEESQDTTVQNDVEKEENNKKDDEDDEDDEDDRKDDEEDDKDDTVDSQVDDEGEDDSKGNEDDTVDSQVDDEDDALANISSKELDLDEYTLTGHFANEIESFNFGKDLEVKNCVRWTVSLDKYGREIYSSKNVPLEEGDNTFYIHLTLKDETVETYTVNIYRNRIVTVMFYANGGTYISPIAIEEGTYVDAPETTRIGYTFGGWSYDFSKPVSDDLFVEANWIANTDTPYTVEYYLMNVQNGRYPTDPTSTVSCTGTTDTTVTVGEEYFEGYQLDTQISVLSGTVSANGDLVLRLYYRSVNLWLENSFIAPQRPQGVILPDAKVGNYTYNSYAISIGSNWNPHAWWETNIDSTILDYIAPGFVSMEALDTEEGLYQWVGEMATSIKDVTADKQYLLTKYNVNLPEGKTAADVTEGYVFEFTLNPSAKWQDGTLINADSYLYSMKQLLNPHMKNYRSNLYISGESAIAGGFNYYHSLDDGLYQGVGTKYANNQEALYLGETLYVDLWNLWDAKGYLSADGKEAPQWAAITDETVYTSADGSDYISGAMLWGGYNSILDVGDGYDAYVAIYVVNENKGASFEEVGLIKTGDYSFIYVCENAIDFDYFLTSCTDTWLVHQGLYEAGMRQVDGMLVTDYMTSKETSMSYGPYMITKYEYGTQIIFEKNPNWYGWEKDANGNLVSYTQFIVDGKYLQQYITSKLVITSMSGVTAWNKFFSGEIDEISLNSSGLSEYKLSERLLVADETYTMSFFFHTNVYNLKALDESGKNMNSVVLSNTNFRKAMSLAINRYDFVTATPAWTPAFSLMNHLYHYDIYNDPSSSYRKSEEAMKAIVNLYGVKYGDGEIYETLEDAHDSITGYNLTEAKALMAQACEELVAAGLYTKGQDIKIQIGWAKGSLSNDDYRQCQLIEKYLNAAVEGSGFGKIVLEPLGNIIDRYGDTANGLYAIGYGAWGGAAFYPFRNLQVYTDPDQYDINEAGCWDPKTERLTLTIEHETFTEEVTMTWQEWGNSMVGNGRYANASNEVKLYITAQLEEKFLAKYYRIPLAVTTICSLSSYKIEYYTDQYNIMYGFGGFRIMDYNYTDAEWAAYVASHGGELNYK